MSGPEGMNGSVALFVPHLGFGGAEKANLNLAEALAHSGRTIHLVAANGSGPLRDRVPECVTLVDLGRRSVTASIARLALYLRRERPELLVSSKTHANVGALLANCLAGHRTRHVLWEHSRYQFEEPQSLADRAFLRLAASLYASADGIVAVSEDVADACAEHTGIERGSVVVIPNPVVTPQMQARLERAVTPLWPAGSGPVFIGAGRLVPEKDFATLLCAFKQVQEHTGGRLVVLGEGPDRSMLEKHARKLDLETVVSMPGFVDDPLPYMGAADVFVLSSRSEGFPIVLVEALYAGCAVVATDCSAGVRDVLDGGCYGKIVPTENPDALADAMLHSCYRELHTNRDRQRARARVYSADRVAADFGELFTTLTDS